MELDNLYNHVSEIHRQLRGVMTLLDQLKPGVVCWRSNCLSVEFLPCRTVPHLVDEYCDRSPHP